MLTEQNARLQDQLNEALATQENLERDVNTQKEIMKQMEANRKEYIQKLKGELLTVESRFHQRVDQAEMVQQDFHSRAVENLDQMLAFKGRYEETQAALQATKGDLAGSLKDLEGLRVELRTLEMANEDLHSRIGLVLLEEGKTLALRVEDLSWERTELINELDEIKIELAEKQRLEAEL